MQQEGAVNHFCPYIYFLNIVNNKDFFLPLIKAETV